MRLVKVFLTRRIFGGFLNPMFLASAFRFLQVPAKQGAVFQDLVEVVHITVGVYVFAGDRLDPFQTFLREFFAVLAIDL